MGYTQALEHHGIPYDPELVICGEFEREIAYREMKKFLTKGPKFDAVFSGDDDSAIGVVKALREADYRIPESHDKIQVWLKNSVKSIHPQTIIA